MVDKLQGTNNYRAWRRDMELSLAAKRKLGFVTGELRRMKVNETKQQGRSISEYYTDLKVLWEELEALNIMPPLTEMNPEITAYVHAQNHQEEQKLFQFLSGLDESYSHQRSQVLLMVKLPKVEEACNIMQQEESQREIFECKKEEGSGLAMNSRKGHTVDNCRFVKGFPPDLEKGKKKGTGNKSLNTIERYGSNKEEGNIGNIKWNKGKTGGRKMAAHVKTEPDEGSSSTVSGSAITAQQLEKLIKMLPTLTKQDNTGTDDEMDLNYSGMVSCNLVSVEPKDWIDSGATHHMSGKKEVFYDLREKEDRSTINLPNGETSEVRGIGDVRLNNGMILKNVMHIPTFKHNLMSVQKLTRDSHNRVMFLPNYCIIQDEKTQEVKGIGKEEKGLYYLHNEGVERMIQGMKKKSVLRLSQCDKQLQSKAMSASMSLKVPDRIEGVQKLKTNDLWHLRLGHAPKDRIKKIPKLRMSLKDGGDECITCPMAKLTRNPYEISQSKASMPFELIHLDIWGP
ncbi:Retrovirus-related Pol polyprotein from transposon RE1 [Bienertia sinuspersici]